MWSRANSRNRAQRRVVISGMNTTSFTLTKNFIGLAALIAFTPALHAQESIEIEEARKAARKLTETAGRILNVERRINFAHGNLRTNGIAGLGGTQASVISF